MATLTQSQLQTVLNNLTPQRIEFDTHEYDRVGNLKYSRNNEDFTIDNDALYLNTHLYVVKSEYTTDINITLKKMYLGDEEFELTDYKQITAITQELKKEILKDLD